MVKYKIKQWNQNCPVLHSKHSSINKNSFKTNNSGNASMCYYYLKVIDFREVKNFTFHGDLSSQFGYFLVIYVKIKEIRED